MYEKENKDYAYQIRTRQYSNISLRNDGSQSIPKYEIQHYGGLIHNFQKPGLVQSYNYSDYQRQLDRRDSTTPRAKDHTRQVPDHHHNSGKSSEEGSVGLYNRRQGSKKQQLQMRMNNINSINDQIYSLLNMVKKDRVYLSKQKVTEEQPFRHAEPRPKSPINKEIAIQSYQDRKEKNGPKRKDAQQYPISVKTHNKSLQRLRALSILEPNLNGKNAKSKQKSVYNQFQYNNQQETENRQRNKPSYSPHKANLYGSKQNTHNCDPNRQKVFQATESKKQIGTYDNCSPTNTYNARSNGVMTHKTPSRFQKMESIKDYTYEEASNFDEVQNPSMSNFSSNYLPITLIKNENSSSEKTEERRQSYSGLKIIEEQIKRIKEKKGQVGYQLESTKQRLDMASPKSQPITAKTSDNDNNFELKVFPVKNDRPETVKIAEKLCFQVEIDNRMKKAKDAFYKIQGQDKWKELSGKLARLNIRMTPNELKDHILPPEGNFKPHPDESWTKKVQIFAQQFAGSRNFWQKHVIGCANLKKLRNEGFDPRSLDLNSKGCLKLEDIVNFVNTYTAHTYKNNDLVTVFRRLQLLENGSNPDIIEYPTFMQAFTM